MDFPYNLNNGGFWKVLVLDPGGSVTSGVYPSIFFFFVLNIFNRPGVAGPVLQTPPSPTN